MGVPFADVGSWHPAVPHHAKSENSEWGANSVTGAFDRWQGEAVWDQQAWQPLSAQDPNSWGRAVVLRSKRDRIAMGAWMTSLEMTAPRNVLIVAMANKLARIAWAVLSTGQDYRAVPEPLPA
jgi:hypothetical protein